MKLLALCADAGLWGELAGDARLVSAVRRAADRVALFVAKQGQ